MTFITLPKEIWLMILKMKSYTAWKKRKTKIQKLLLNRIMPVEKHSTSFFFRGFQIWYYRTEHLDITVQKRREEISLVYVLNVEVKEKELINCVSLRFVYCPTFYLN